MELFARLVQGDVRGIENADREFASESAMKVALLGRLGLITGGDFDDTRASSVSMGDLAFLSEMKAREPTNGFWTLAEYAIRKREGIDAGEEDPYAWVDRSGAVYRNPLTEFYGEVRKKTLADEQAYVAGTMMYSRAPIVSFSVLRAAMEDIPSAEPAQKERLYRVGWVMQSSQLGPSGDGLDGFTGSLLDAWVGRRMMGRIEGETFNSVDEYSAMRRRFGFSDEDTAGVLAVFDRRRPEECDSASYTESWQWTRRKLASAHRLRPSPRPLPSGNPEETF
jgi:hypothetical protein